jgi:NOL1/NOP2/fmu family ribosome biogenesis protein
MGLRIMERKDRKKFLSLLENVFGFSLKLEYAFFMNDQQKVYVVNKDVDQVLDARIRIDKIGMYIAEWKDRQVRLSIEGSQLVGPAASKNVLEVSAAEVRRWIKGEDLDTSVEGKGFVIIKHGDDYLGSGKIGERKVYNYVSKNRKLQVSD